MTDKTVGHEILVNVGYLTGNCPIQTNSFFC